MATKSKPVADLAYLCRALKAPSLAQSVERLAERARAESWTHEEFLAACFEREVAARQSNGGEIRIRAARLPARKSPRGVRLRSPTELEARRDRPSRSSRLRRGQGQRHLLGSTGHWQDTSGHRSLDPGLPGRPPGAVRHCSRMGGPSRPSPRRRQTPRRAHSPRAATH